MPKLTTTTNDTTATAFDLDGNPVAIKGKPSQVITAKNFAGLGQIERENKESGFYFFSKDTMAFFKSKLGAYLGAGVFLTKETNPCGKTAFTIRVATASNDIATFGEFHSYDIGKTANADGKALARLLMEGKSVVDEKGKVFRLDLTA